MEQQWEWGSASLYPVDAPVVMSAPTLRLEKQSGWGQRAPLPCGRTRGDVGPNPKDGEAVGVGAACPSTLWTHPW